MASGPSYEKNFPFPLAYDFLKDHGLEEAAREIESSRDHYMSYGTSLKRAKILVLVREMSMYDQFVQEVWQSGRTDKGIRRSKFLEGLYEKWAAESTDEDDDYTEDRETIEELE